MVFSWFKKKNKVDERPIENQLIIKYEYEHSSWGGYSSTTKLKRGYIDELIFRFKQRTFNNVILISEYNGVKYPFFDIDELDKYNHFIRNFKEIPYVVFQSSPGHFWVIVDKPFVKYFDFMKDELFNDWVVYSDTNYQKMTNDRSEFHIRGDFKNLERQPTLIEKYGEFNQNFSEFISKLESYFECDCLELSTLRYNDPDMLLKLRRIKKLNRVIKPSQNINI